jgi:RNA polymerase subunit RPABC4/transcription elongation factor Spt4
MKCPSCNGNNKCKSCNGTGVVLKGLFSKIEKPCNVCNGTGVCIFCKSTGEINHEKKTSDVEYAKCGNCGEIIPADSDNCQGCGVSFGGEWFECPECRSVVSAESKRCDNCGAEYKEL